MELGTITSTRLQSAVASACNDCGAGTCSQCGSPLKTRTSEPAAAKQQSDRTSDAAYFSPAGKGTPAEAHPRAKETTAAELTDEEKTQVDELKKRDTEVRAHEQAHAGALGAHAAGGPSYSFTTGPDGKRYAAGGEVPVELSEGSTPQQTVEKMQTIKRAASAPAEPSAADQRVAAQAGEIEAKAHAELAEQTQSAAANSSGNSYTADPGSELSPLRARGLQAYTRASENVTTGKL